jgi:hypothetical protein
MPRYFFHVRNGGFPLDDETGEVHRTIEATSRGVVPVNQCGRQRAERFLPKAAVFVADPVLRARAPAAVTLQELRSGK